MYARNAMVAEPQQPQIGTASPLHSQEVLARYGAEREQALKKALKDTAAAEAEAMSGRQQRLASFGAVFAHHIKPPVQAIRNWPQVLAKPIEPRRQAPRHPVMSSAAPTKKTQKKSAIVRPSKLILVEGQPPNASYAQSRSPAHDDGTPALVKVSKSILIEGYEAPKVKSPFFERKRDADCVLVLQPEQRRKHDEWPAKKKRRVKPGKHHVYSEKGIAAKKRHRANGKFETSALRKARLGEW
jgi:hypothetical protein